eukprot:CAMPEP_0184677086 /NCGR_PEP_ID=MMETSP0308-20130426/88697_1 /TAXON_ID=38269 /ORGANISM="Gloeochaete witrockiana, Strain SAG 46.84" /LENGTH=362 /DNA_ID=CAMNT_0027124961 /DNA_START=429 /DNA_END=1514 /DNA_ORIENTATION=+
MAVTLDLLKSDKRTIVVNLMREQPLVSEDYRSHPFFVSKVFGTGNYIFRALWADGTVMYQTVTFANFPNPCGTVHGSSHILTLDGTLVTYLGCGDYTMLQDDGSFQYQARHCRRHGMGTTTCAVALRCNRKSPVVEIYTTPTHLKVLIGGTEIQPLGRQKASIIASDAVRVRRNGNRLSVECLDSEFVLHASVKTASRALYIESAVEVPPAMSGVVRGLLGSLDSRKDNDVTYRGNGQIWHEGHGMDYISEVDHPDLSHVQNSWLVLPRQRLFTYDEHSSGARCLAHIKSSQVSVHKKSVHTFKESALRGTAKGMQWFRAHTACAKLGLPRTSIFMPTCQFDYVSTNGDMELVQNSMEFAIS